MRVITSIALLMLLVGCQSAGGGGPSETPSRTPVNRPTASNTQDTARPKAQTNPPTQTATTPQPKPGWTPEWWLDKPTRVSGGAVQASGTATAGDLRDARRQAIDSAREAALTLADAGQRERVVQAATNPNANGSFTVWVVLELGGQ